MCGLTKICTTCKQEKEKHLFCKGINLCLDCKKEKNRRYQESLTKEQKEERKEKDRIKSKRRRDENPDKYREIQERSLAKRRDKELAKGLSNPIYYRVCAKCGKKDVLRKEPNGVLSKDYCSVCYRYAGANKGKKIHRPMVNECVHCGTQFNATAGMNRVCPVCNHQKKVELKRIYKSKRRALEKGVHADNIDKYKVFSADKWRCRMCGCKVQKKRIHDDDAAELDHVIPLSKGGTHTWDNVQTLCRSCNQKKSDSVAKQLRMVLR